MKKHFILIYVVCLNFCGSINAQRLYVNGSKSISGDGSSWTTAIKTIEEAAILCKGNEIWVARGSYALPTIDIASSLAIYGGFAGNETSLDQRVIGQNVTKLTSQTNSTIFNINSSNQTFVFDGFEITGTTQILKSDKWNENNSYTLNSLNVHDVVGGIDLGSISIYETGSVVLKVSNSVFERCSAIIYTKDKYIRIPSFNINISKCVFKNSSSQLIYFYLSNEVVFEECHFLGNSFSQRSDLVFIQRTNNCRFSNTVFENNDYISDLACITISRTLLFESCKFLNNKVGKDPHLVWSNQNDSLVVCNSLFQGNVAGIYNYIFSDNDMYARKRKDRVAIIKSSTFIDNSLAGIISDDDKPYNKDKVEFYNNIVWNNNFLTNTPIGEAQFVIGNVRNSCIGTDQKFGAYAQSDTISANPQFTNPTNNDFTLSCSSPCINTGANPIDFNGLKDLAGNVRVQEGNIDMGAYESNVPYCGATPTSLGGSIAPKAEQLQLSNPVIGKCRISCENMTRVQVFKTDGSLIKDVRVDASETTIDFQNEASGIFLIKVYNNKGEVRSGKILKQ